MKILNKSFQLITIIIAKELILILCQLCSNVWRDAQVGMASYEIEKEKGTLLTKSGYICNDSEPFSIIFRLNDDLDQNITELLSNSEKLLRGTQKVLDNYIGKYTNVQRPSDVTEVNKFLNKITECIPKEIRCPIILSNTTCDTTEKYRSFDGSCNNLEKPYQGAALTAYSRLDDTTTFYDDDVMEIRKSVSGADLTSPRIIIDKLLLNIYNSDDCFSESPNMGWLLFGQLLTHDIAGSINNMHEKATEPDDPPIRCCSQDYKKLLPNPKMHPNCLPFSISPDDQYHRNTKLQCHNYIRNKFILPNDCRLKGAQQINRVSHYLDLSVIYGSSNKKADKLRTRKDGKLLVSDGDFRALQIPSLGLLHLIFIRLHNIIADNIKKHIPNWNNEKLFQEARRLNIAIYQNIIYNNYLPILLNENIENDDNYNISVDGSTTNDFNTGVFRQLHWFIPGTVDLYSANDEIISIPYEEMILNKNDYFETNFSSILQNIILQSINMGKIDEQIFNKLFNQSDLLSIDIQRGRDHGIAPYWKYREICGSKHISSFTDLHPMISEDNIYHLAKIYKSPLDIDLYVGGGLERKQCGELIGPTMKCLTKLQFQRYKNGDRFFFTNKNYLHSFSRKKIDAIKLITFSSILCSTTDAKYVPKNGFLVPNSNNEFIDCSEVKVTDFINTLKL